MNLNTGRDFVPNVWLVLYFQMHFLAREWKLEQVILRYMSTARGSTSAGNGCGLQ